MSVNNDLKFDADGEQRVEMNRTVNRKRYPIAHVLHPILDDERVF